MPKTSKIDGGRAKILLDLVLTGLKVGLPFVVIVVLVSTVFKSVFPDPKVLENNAYLLLFATYLLWLPLIVFLMGRGFAKSQPNASLLARLDLTRPTWKTIAWGLIVVLALNALFIVLSAVLDWLGLADADQQQLVIETMPEGGWQLFWLFMVAGLLAPIAEELIFRRLLYRSLVDLGGFWLALPLASLLFGLAHPESFLVVILATILAVGLTMVYRWSGNLWPPIVMHITHNTLILSLVSLGYT